MYKSIWFPRQKVLSYRSDRHFEREQMSLIWWTREHTENQTKACSSSVLSADLQTEITNEIEFLQIHTYVYILELTELKKSFLIGSKSIQCYVVKVTDRLATRLNNTFAVAGNWDLQHDSYWRHHFELFLHRKSSRSVFFISQRGSLQNL